MGQEVATAPSGSLVLFRSQRAAELFALAGSSRGTIATSIAKPLSQSTGNAIQDASGTVHGRSVLAPQYRSATETGSRNQTGIGMMNSQSGARVAATTRTTHWRHRSGRSANETAAMAAVTPNAIPSERHSRRNTNHSRPIPGLTLVRRTNAHVH